jgi:hypothetical protein
LNILNELKELNNLLENSKKEVLSLEGLDKKLSDIILSKLTQF